jgi:transposase-like protein
VDEIVLSLYAKGLTTGEISAHFAEIYGAPVSKEAVSRITDGVIEEMNDCPPAPGRHLRGGVHRRDRGQGPGWAVRESAVQCWDELKRDIRGHFPNEQAALKCLYLVTRSLDPTGTGG